MKKFLPLVLFLSILLYSCSNPFNNHEINKNSVSDKGKVYINLFNELPLRENSSRTVGPVNGKSLNDVSEWKFTFTCGDVVHESISSLEDSSCEFELPIGEGYRVYIEGSVDSDTNQIYCGEETFDVSSSSPTNVTVLVGRKRISKGKLNFSITMGNNILIPEGLNGESLFEVTVIDLSEEGKTYTSNSEDLDTDISAINLAVNFSGNVLQINSNDENIKSGFYKLLVSYKNGNFNYYLNIPDPYIEICDGCTSAADIKINGIPTSRTYYVKSEESLFNGLTEEYPANFTSLFDAIKEKNDWNEINFKFESSDDVSSISSLNFASLLPSGKSVNLYSGDLKFIDSNELVTSFYVSADESCTDEEGNTVKAAANIKRIADLIDKVDYSTEDVSIVVEGKLDETEMSTFSKVKNISITGAAGDPEDHDLGNITDILDWGEQRATYGLNFDNNYNNGVIESITIRNIKISGAIGVDDAGNSGQSAGLRFGYANGATDNSVNSINVTNCLFEFNAGGSEGQSILLMRNSLPDDASIDQTPLVNISGCKFNECGRNKSTGKGFDGGVIRVLTPLKSLIIENCEFANNYSPDISINDSVGMEESKILLKGSAFTDNKHIATEFNLPENKANIVLKGGELTLGAGNTCLVAGTQIKIAAYKGNTINVVDKFQVTSEFIPASYVLHPTRFEQYTMEADYSQTEPLIKVTVPEGEEEFTLEDVLGYFSLEDTTQSIDSTAHIVIPTIVKGSGTADDPYLIGSLADYDYFSDKIGEGATNGTNPYNRENIYYKVTDDLDFSDREQWSSKSFDQKTATTGTNGGFYGIFDGDGHTFRGMKGDVALFYIIYDKAVVKNLAIEGDFLYTGDRGFTTQFSPFSMQAKGYVTGCSFKGTSTVNITNPSSNKDIASYIFGTTSSATTHLVGCLVTLTDGSSIPIYNGTVKTDAAAYSNSTEKTADELNALITTFNSNKNYPTNAHCEWTFVEKDGELTIVRSE